MSKYIIIADIYQKYIFFPHAIDTIIHTNSPTNIVKKPQKINAVTEENIAFIKFGINNNKFFP